MGNTIKARRGTGGSLLEAGELGLKTDSLEVFIGTGTENVQMAVQPRIHQFALTDTKATFLTLLADETIDIIEMATGTYTWAATVIDIDRVNPIIVRPAAGATIVFSGATCSPNGQFYFGQSTTAGNIHFEHFTFDGYTLADIGIVWMMDAHDCSVSDIIVQNCTNDGENGAPEKSWAVYLSSDATHFTEDIVLDRWTVDGGVRTIGGLQVVGGNHISAKEWVVSHAWFAIYTDDNYGPALAHLVLEDWAINDCSSSGGRAVSFTDSGGQYTNLLLTASGIVYNEGTPRMTAITTTNISVDDHAVMRGDAALAGGIQDSLVTIDDAGKMFIPEAIRITKTASGAYLDILITDVTTTFDGNDTDGWMDFVFKSNGVEKATLSGATGNLSIDGSLTEGVASLLKLSGGTMTDDITLGEGAGIALDPAGSADEKFTGIKIAGTAGATLAVGDLCYLDVSATEWLLADANAAATAGSVVLGICILAANNAQATKMLLLGTIRSAAFPASIALGAPVYVSTTAGDITATQPTGTDDVIRVVGWAISAEPNTIYFCPSADYITHV